jgi:hypothetical protein
MDLKNFLSSKQPSEKECYWALVIEPGWVQAGVWEIEGEQARVISISPTTHWEADEDLLGAADTVLSVAAQKLEGEIAEPSKTVFGVPSSWVSEGQINEESLGNIRRVCGELSLEPVGFVVLPEAIAHLFKAEEGAPLNAVVLGAGQDILEVSVFRLGNLIGTYNVARSVSVADDVTEGLSRFGQVDPLPSRFILYDGKEGDLEDVRQALLENSWDGEKIKFLHTPKIEIISGEKKVLATALAGASEIANVTSIEVKKDKFASSEEGSQKENLENLTYPETKIAPEDLGFVVGKDIKNLPRQDSGKDKEENVFNKNQVQERVPLEVNQEERYGRSPNILDSLKKIGPKMLAFLHRIFKNREGSGTNRIFILGVILLFLVGLGGFALWWYIPKAIVTIYIQPKKLDEKISITVDPSISQPDFSKDLLPGQIVKTHSLGDKTRQTTGTKVVGENAKGSVKAENGTGEPINLPKGTVFIAANDLRFTSNSGASVSAALSPGSPGNAIIDVTASNIGAEYNLARDERFRVGNYPKSEVDAISIDVFSGGTSRQISAVSLQDQKNLEDDLKEQLLSKGKEDLRQGLSEDRLFIDESVNATSSSRLFSNKVGDEASDLKLTLDLSVSGLSVSKASLIDLAKESIKNKIPQGYILRDGDLKLTFSFKGVKKGVYQFDLTISANLLPEVKPDDIAKNITGKYTDVAYDYLKGIPGFNHVEVTRKPNLPGKLGNLPWVTKHITIEVEAEK